MPRDMEMLKAQRDWTHPLSSHPELQKSRDSKLASICQPLRLQRIGIWVWHRDPHSLRFQDQASQESDPVGQCDSLFPLPCHSFQESCTPAVAKVIARNWALSLLSPQLLHNPVSSAFQLFLTESLGNILSFERVLKRVITKIAKVSMPASPQIPHDPLTRMNQPSTYKRVAELSRAGQIHTQQQPSPLCVQVPLGRIYSFKNKLETKKEKEMLYVSYLVNSVMVALVSLSRDNTQSNLIFMPLFSSLPYLHIHT